MFDEMSLEAGLHYDPQKDIIFGMEDLGEDKRHISFADHVLTFMIKGIRKTYNQPISFYFVNGTIKTKDLVCTLKNVIKTLTNIGLEIIATVSDQGSTNVAAINYLRLESMKLSQSENIENFYGGNIIDDYEIIHIYDPPHLLKSIRNNLLNKSVQFTWRGKTQTAIWTYIFNLYNLDKKNENVEMRTLPKLTEAHVLINKIKKMKVSIASQVFSHRVASTMKLMCDLG